jgi:small-conductance mechanosensitive channel
MAKEPAENIDPNWTPPVGDPATEPPKKDDAPDPIAELKAQLERERNSRADAERRANEMAQTVHRSQNEVADSQMQLVMSAISRVKESSDQLEGALEQAMAAQDFRAAAKIQRELSANEAKLLQLENGKTAMESQPKPQAPQLIRTEQRDPVEALASQLTPRSAAWVRAHPQCARDPKLYQAMIAAHNLAVSRDIEPDTDEYFQTVEATVFNKKSVARDVEDDDAEDPMAAAAKAAPARQTAPPSAPVSRGGPNGRGVRLSPAEREAAEMSGMSEQEYAAAREEMKKSGRIH